MYLVNRKHIITVINDAISLWWRGQTVWRKSWIRVLGEYNISPLFSLYSPKWLRYVIFRCNGARRKTLGAFSVTWNTILAECRINIRDCDRKMKFGKTINPRQIHSQWSYCVRGTRYYASGSLSWYCPCLLRESKTYYCLFWYSAGKSIFFLPTYWWF